MATAVRRQRRQYCKDKKNFFVGQKVWLFTPRVAVGESKKLAPLWTGPWTIISAPSDLLYTLGPEPSWVHVRDYITVGIDRLKPYKGPDPYGQHQPPEPGMDLNMEGDEFCEHLTDPSQEPRPQRKPPAWGGGNTGGQPPPPPLRPPSLHPSSQPSSTPQGSSLTLGFGTFDSFSHRSSPQQFPGTPAPSEEPDESLVSPQRDIFSPQAQTFACSPDVPADATRMSERWPAAPPHLTAFNRNYYALAGSPGADDPKDKTFDIRDASSDSQDSRRGHRGGGGKSFSPFQFIRGQREEEPAEPEATAMDRPRRRAATAARFRLAEWTRDDDSSSSSQAEKSETLTVPATSPTVGRRQQPLAAADLATRLTDPEFEQAMRARSQLTARTPPAGPSQQAQRPPEDTAKEEDDNKKEEEERRAYEARMMQRSTKTLRTP